MYNCNHGDTMRQKIITQPKPPINRPGETEWPWPTEGQA